MAAKKNGPSSKSGNNTAGRQSRRAKKPVTIDLSASANPAKDGPARAANSPIEPISKPLPKTVPKVAAKAAKSKLDEKTSGNVKTMDQGAGKIDPKKPGDQPRPASVSGSPKTEKTAISGKPASSNGGRFVAGLAGGAIALGGAWLLQTTGNLLSGDADRSGVTEVNERIAKLESRINETSSSLAAIPKTDLSPLVERLAKLEEIEKNRAAAVNTKNNGQAGANGKIVALEEAIESLKVTGAALQKSISAGAAGENAGLSAMDERIAIMEKSISDMSGTNRQNTDQGEIEDIGARIDQLTTGLAAISNNLASGESRSAQEIALLGTRLGAINQQLSVMETNINTPQKDEQRVARAIAVARLKSAIDSGKNYSEALTLFESLADESMDVSALKPFAQDGIPTIGALKTSFGPLSDAILKATAPKNDVGVVDKFLSNARSLVKIKTTRDAEGSGPGAIISRIETALNSGDLVKVASEWDALPDSAKVISKGWIASLAARQQANSLIDNLLKQFLAGVAGAGN